MCFENKLIVIVELLKYLFEKKKEKELFILFIYLNFRDRIRIVINVLGDSYGVVIVVYFFKEELMGVEIYVID